MAYSKKTIRKVNFKEEAISDDDVVALIFPIKVEQIDSSEKDAEKNSYQSPKKSYKRICPPRDDSGSSAEEDSEDDYRRLGVKQKRRRKQSAEVKNESSESSPDSNSETATNSESDSDDEQEVPPSRKSERKRNNNSDSDSVEPNIEFSSGDEDQGSDKSHTTTEESEEDDDSDEICIVCRNLGGTVVKGRRFKSSTSWCTCHECKIWKSSMGDYDRVCCRELADVMAFLHDEMEVDENTCITSHPRFEQDVLKSRALKRTNYSLNNNYGNSKAYMAAWSFVRWVFNRIGWGTRIMIPACVRAKILETYPGDYLQNFCSVKTCSKRLHCK